MRDAAIPSVPTRRDGAATTFSSADAESGASVALRRARAHGTSRLASQTVVLGPGSSTPSASGPFAEFLRRRRFASLDGLRALGVLAVVWHHTVARGFGGVSLFFALSGFLIATSLVRAGRSGTFSVRSFYSRTARRILPLYFAVLAIYLGMVGVLERDAVAKAQFFANLPAFATFTANWFVDLNHPRVIFYFVWSLSAQVQFYLLWPWVERSQRTIHAVVAAMVLLVVSQTIAGFAGATAREVLWLRVLSGVPAGIMAGVLLAHALHAPRTFAWLQRLCGRRGSGLGALAVVVGLALFPATGGAWHETLAAFAHVGLIATCVVREDHDLAPVLRWRLLAQAGVMSYGIYLLHMLAVNLVRRGEAWWNFESAYLEFALGVAVAFGLALASHHFWEKRFVVARST